MSIILKQLVESIWKLPQDSDSFEIHTVDIKLEPELDAKTNANNLYYFIKNNIPKIFKTGDDKTKEFVLSIYKEMKLPSGKWGNVADRNYLNTFWKTFFDLDNTYDDVVLGKKKKSK